MWELKTRLKKSRSRNHIPITGLPLLLSRCRRSMKNIIAKTSVHKVSLICKLKRFTHHRQVTREKKKNEWAKPWHAFEFAALFFSNRVFKQNIKLTWNNMIPGQENEGFTVSSPSVLITALSRIRRNCCSNLISLLNSSILPSSSFFFLLLFSHFLGGCNQECQPLADYIGLTADWIL